jgi:hypothetical protein
MSSGTPGDSPTDRVVGPLLWQIQSVGHRQATQMGGHRETHRHLAVVLLAQLAAVLPGYTHRVAAFLRKARVIHDPALDRFVSSDRWQHALTYAAQYRLIRPGCLRHQMQQRLVLRGGSLRRGHRRQWFHALSTLRRQQPDTVVLKRSDPVSMAQYRGQVGRISPEASFRASFIVEIHPTLLASANLHCYQTAIASGQAQSYGKGSIFVLPRYLAGSNHLELGDQAVRIAGQSLEHIPTLLSCSRD